MSRRSEQSALAEYKEEGATGRSTFLPAGGARLSIAMEGDRDLHLYHLTCCALCSVVASIYAEPILALVVNAAHIPTDALLRYILLMDCLVAVLAYSAVRLRGKTAISRQPAPNLISLQTNIEKLREHQPTKNIGLAFGEVDSDAPAQPRSLRIPFKTARRTHASKARGVDGWDNGELARRLESDQLRLRANVSEGRNVESSPSAGSTDESKFEFHVTPEDGRLLFLALANGMKRRGQEATVQDLAGLIKYVGQSGHGLLSIVRSAKAGQIAVSWNGRDWVVDQDNQDYSTSSKIET